jgi:hypothetical protein
MRVSIGGCWQHHIQKQQQRHSRLGSDLHKHQRTDDNAEPDANTNLQHRPKTDGRDQQDQIKRHGISV